MVFPSVIGRTSPNTPLRAPLVTQCRRQALHFQSRYLTATRSLVVEADDVDVSKEIKTRKQELDAAPFEPYPRYTRNDTEYLSLHAFAGEYGALAPGESREVSTPVEVQGRITAIRTAGARLVFLDIAQGDGQKLQVLLNHAQLEHSGLDRKAFVDYRRLLQRGDVISVRGCPHRTKTEELSIKATELPKILAPSLHQLPLMELSSKSIAMQGIQTLDKHVEMLSNRETIQVLVRRSEVINQIRTFFESRQFVEVQTPILAGSAGGAAARPFETTATEFEDRKLSLRIAPELWLKRLIVGGMDRIFEIGPCFRNEGLDKTHNPEFTTCEFYSTYTTLPELLTTTETLLDQVCKHLHNRVNDQTSAYSTGTPLPIPQPRAFFEGPYPQIDFIPALNDALHPLQLPDLSSSITTPESAVTSLLSIFTEKSLPISNTPTLPRLLDKLASIYLEPLCDKPTWIINHPECLSPLSKSFIHPTVPHSQSVAARAELFVHAREIVNCYEEENSPFEQRRKFKMQQQYANPPIDGDRDGNEGSAAAVRDDEVMPVDEDYLRALEWGLPPTGGWGCGIDRIVMLFTGKERIGDVLSFGNLRAVTRATDREVK